MRGPGAPPCPACGFSSHRRCAHASPGGCDTSRRQLALAGRACPMPYATRRASVRGRDTDARAVRPADQRAPGRWVGPTSRLLRHEHEQNLAILPSHSTCRAPPACEPPQTGCSESKAGCRYAGGALRARGVAGAARPTAGAHLGPWHWPRPSLCAPPAWASSKMRAPRKTGAPTRAPARVGGRVSRASTARCLTRRGDPDGRDQVGSEAA